MHILWYIYKRRNIYIFLTNLKVKVGLVVIGVGDDDAHEDGGQHVRVLHRVDPVRERVPRSVTEVQG